MNRYKLLSQVGAGAYKGSFLAEDMAKGSTVRIRAYPKDEKTSPLIASVLLEAMQSSQFMEVIDAQYWLITIQPYDAWWQVKEIYSRRARLQTRRAAARIVAQLGLEIESMGFDSHAVPSIYPDNIIVSASGDVAFWHYLPPSREGVPPGYPSYMAPEEFAEGRRSSQSLVFNLGATLYELVEGRKLSRAKIEDTWRANLRLDRPFGRWFKRLVENPFEWLARAPESRASDIRIVCERLIEITRPNGLQTLLQLSDEPRIEVDNRRLSTLWLDDRYDQITHLLGDEIEHVLNWKPALLSQEERERWALVHELDRRTIQYLNDAKHPVHKRVVLNQYVQYDELTVSDLITYLNLWQSLFQSYRVISGLGSARLRVESFHTGSSFRSKVSVVLPKDKPSPPAMVDPTGGLLALKEVIGNTSLDRLPSKERRAVEKALKAVEAASKTDLRSQVTLEPMPRAGGLDE